MDKTSVSLNGMTGDSARGIEKLRKLVETVFKYPLKTAKDFEALSESIFNRIGVMMSPTTLKRVWGYLNEHVNTRQTTLDILARYCGWQDFNDFCQRPEPDVESGNVGTATINVDRDVKIGDRVQLMWAPSRVCVIEYDGHHQWHVVSSEGTRLSPGDTFKCALIVEKEPLYLDELLHSGTPPGVYICGRKNGVRFIR